MEKTNRPLRQVGSLAGLTLLSQRQNPHIGLTRVSQSTCPPIPTLQYLSELSSLSTHYRVHSVKTGVRVFTVPRTVSGKE